MSRNAVGFNPGQSLLSGLRGTPSYGKAMAATSQLNLEADTENKKSMLKETQQDNQRDQKKNEINAQTGQNNLKRDAQNKQANIGEAKAHGRQQSANLLENRKNHWKDRNTVVNGLLS